MSIHGPSSASELSEERRGPVFPGAPAWTGAIGDLRAGCRGPAPVKGALAPLGGYAALDGRLFGHGKSAPNPDGARPERQTHTERSDS